MSIETPPVTVLMPAYNASLYIRQAMDSILSQTFRDFEFVIINDGSTDDTEAIIRSYKDDRIKLYTQENKGVIGALNCGLELAKGKYIARFDADDVCYAQRLAIQYEYMQANKDFVLIGSAADYIDRNGDFLFEWQPPAYDTDSLKMKMLEESPFDHPTVMYNKEVALKIGGYPKGAIHFEDHLFWTHFSEYGQIANMHEPLIQHRFNPESVTIDEKWRGREFAQIKYRSIENGTVSAEDEQRLRKLLVSQELKDFKEAAYYSMVAKKYLWNQHDPVKARQHLRKAISIMPFRREPYMLFVLSLFPERVVTGIYNRMKK